MNDKLNVLFLGGAKRVSLAEHLIDTARRKVLTSKFIRMSWMNLFL